MKSTCQERLPLAPLLRSYVQAGAPTAAELHRLPGLGPRFAAVLSATARFLFTDFLDRSTDEVGEALGRFYDATSRLPLHADTLKRRAGFLRHALSYLLRGRDPLPVKAESVLSASGAYHVPGLGPSFWSALLQGLAPGRNPGWLPSTLAGLRRLGLERWPRSAGPAVVYAGLLDAYAHVRTAQPGLSALHIDHFLSLVAAMPGRGLWEGGEPGACPFEEALHRERRRLPLRERLKSRGQALAAAQELLESGLAARDGKRIGDALATADPTGAARAPLDWGAHGEMLTLWAGRLWEADDPYPLLSDFWEADPLPGAGLWLPAAVLHLRDPQRFLPWDDELRRGYALLDDSIAVGPPSERYRLHNEGANWLRARYSVHPLELPSVLALLARGEDGDETAGGAPAVLRTAAKQGAFGGFCGDTFRFLDELGRENRREWMEAQRDRYRFAVREPLAELCRALADRYVRPVLGKRHGWQLDTEARSGRALTSICKNAYGRARPYNTTLWIAFCRAGERRAGAQLFVRLDALGLRYGLRLGREARGALELLRANVERYAGPLHQALRDSGAILACQFGATDGPGACPEGPAELRTFAAGRTIEVSRRLAPDDPLLGSEELVGDIVLTFDRLLPLYACAVEPDAGAFLGASSGSVSEGFGDGDFVRETYLSGDWLRRARDLLGLKRQLILQGVPGTGKTHVARCLARLLTGGRDEAMRLVQFHPAYSYEEFVEGIRARSVTIDGRHDVTYPVEDGLLCAFAAEAQSKPAQAHVLLIDEINRGNLPRIFGELLFLLEYRDQAVGLPYSRRGFRLPNNLYLLGTMNAADRSVAMIDQALRRRFSFLEMLPDASVLAAWLRDHPPTAGPALADKVLALFERLNARLRTDLGPHAQVGHSYFMVPQLDEMRLRMVWQHHVRPLLDEHFVGQPGRSAAYDLDRLLDEGPRGRRREPAGTAR
jgi:MoxR-like ATPase